MDRGMVTTKYTLTRPRREMHEKGPGSFIGCAAGIFPDDVFSIINIFVHFVCFVVNRLSRGSKISGNGQK